MRRKYESEKRREKKRRKTKAWKKDMNKEK